MEDEFGLLEGFMSDLKTKLEPKKYLVDYAMKPDLNAFKDFKDEKIDSLKESIKEINDLVELRTQLHKELLGDLDDIRAMISNSMPPIEQTRDSNLGSRLKNELVKRKIEIEEIQVAEKLNCWRDIALLKRELRERMKEFRDQQTSNSLIDRFLD